MKAEFTNSRMSKVRIVGKNNKECTVHNNMGVCWTITYPNRAHKDLESYAACVAYLQTRGY